MAGPLAPQPLSSLIYGTYTGLVYATPLLGGWVADNYLGQRNTAMIGIVLMGLGHFMMAAESLLFPPALLVLIFGVGFFKTNTTAQVGMLYGPDDPRRDKAYSVYYVGTNIGAMSPFIVGTLGETVGWHYGFGAAGFGMMIALAVYVLGWKYLPAEGLRERKTTATAKQPLNKDEWMSVGALVLLVLPLSLWWACYEQSGNVVSLFADTALDRRLLPRPLSTGKSR